MEGSKSSKDLEMELLEKFSEVALIIFKFYLVEKKKTGEMFAAKIVSNLGWLRDLTSETNLLLGKSHQELETRHALLGKQTHSQAQGQKY